MIEEYTRAAFEHKVKLVIQEVGAKSLREECSFRKLLNDWLEDTPEVDEFQIYDDKEGLRVDVKPVGIDSTVEFLIRKKKPPDWVESGF